MAPSIRLGFSQLPYTGSWDGPELSQGPMIMEQGLREQAMLKRVEIEETSIATLTPDEEGEYGAWHRLGLASRHLGEMIASQRRRGLFPLALLSNCSGLMGVLGGLQRTGRRPLRVGLVYCDAHADYNTPETSLSGMLGGMPVAVSTGLCLSRLRMECGLDPALPSRYVVMVGVRDVDPLERELLDRSEITQISVEEVKEASQSIDLEVERLERLTDVIYVHVDLDILDPSEVTGHRFLVEGGPSSMELSKALSMIFEHHKVGAFGIASYPAGGGERSMEAVKNLFMGVLEGLERRA
ncbi:MAG: arginase family protein [Candidatus Bathyarchaeia archaeon]|nr:arginase family protein [Candidatus Bathyarchaeota archaeon]